MLLPYMYIAHNEYSVRGRLSVRSVVKWPMLVHPRPRGELAVAKNLLRLTAVHLPLRLKVVLIYV